MATLPGTRRPRRGSLERPNPEETLMEEYVGLDVSQKTTVVCVVDAQGRRVWTGKCASTPEAIGATVRAEAPGATRVGLETGPLSTWLYHGLKALGVPVVCLDA